MSRLLRFAALAMLFAGGAMAADAVGVKVPAHQRLVLPNGLTIILLPKKDVPLIAFSGFVRGGSLEFFHGHGVAQVASDTAITEDTVLRIASITKTVTAVAVMQHCERGPGRHRCAREQVPARPPTGPSEPELPAGHRTAPADPHGRHARDRRATERSAELVARRRSTAGSSARCQ